MKSSKPFSFFAISFSKILILVLSLRFSSLIEFDYIFSFMASSYNCSFSLILFLLGLILDTFTWLAFKMFWSVAELAPANIGF